MKLVDKNNRPFSAIILAGGKSSRMGFPKPWLTIGNITFLEQIITTFQSAEITDIGVVINDLFCTGKWQNKIRSINNQVNIIENKEVNKGRLYSIKLGLENSFESSYTFIYNVDNPFVGESILRKLQANVNVHGATIPSYNNKGGHPIIINELIKEEIISNYKKYSSLKSVLNGYKKKYVDVENPAVLANINTQEDYLLSLV